MNSIGSSSFSNDYQIQSDCSLSPGTAASYSQAAPGTASDLTGALKDLVDKAHSDARREIYFGLREKAADMVPILQIETQRGRSGRSVAMERGFSAGLASEYMKRGMASVKGQRSIQKHYQNYWQP
ncbi:hypothetical protein [Burkholderia sp. TSV86]|uniref:hypothetical protein n=1 Tax=Burkholderia sp. TSV86 TaxID=1385594 RepID=UPI0007532C63|nr:hypothetical protein [Burkholderia sp. TSV86]KVE33679.1 hypothetical protein WS68_10865 [Burkholderia sp. TSV86]